MKTKELNTNFLLVAALGHLLCWLGGDLLLFFVPNGPPEVMGLFDYGKTAQMRKEGDVCFYKGALGSRELLVYLMEHPVDEMELCGLVSNMCVLSNAIVVKAACPECRVAVNEKLTMSFDLDLHAKAMDVLRGVQVDVL